MSQSVVIALIVLYVGIACDVARGIACIARVIYGKLMQTAQLDQLRNRIIARYEREPGGLFCAINTEVSLLERRAVQRLLYLAHEEGFDPSKLPAITSAWTTSEILAAYLYLQLQVPVRTT